ncbi:MAG: protease pro-enzyme activation domain-containing protein, partial [Acidimicrobiales bacterium]
GPVELPVGTRAEGAVPGAAAVTVEVVLEPADPAALEAFDTAVSTPGSALYRRYLGPGRFAARFGASAPAIAATRAWLAGQGLTVGATAPDGLFVRATGPAATVSRAFSVGLT